MMNDILNLLQSGKACTTAEISQVLNLAPAMVTAQIEYLEQLGYLQKISLSEDCGGSCSSCSKDCGSRQTGNALFTAWEIAPKP